MSKLIAAVVALAALLITTGAAVSATVSIVSMHYSAAYPVPHIAYDGETAAGDVDLLKGIYENFVKCRLSCIGPEGGTTAIVTLSGPGGDYAEGLAMAEFFRENHIATVVERGNYCYSACAFAFLGGTGYSPQDGVGDFVDRMVEPGATLGFHAPYAEADAFVAALSERGAMAVQGDTRSNLALMVKELVRWNVDPEVLYYFVKMGPDETYDIVNADDYYMARTALPPTPTRDWITDLPSAVKNACTYLLAIDEHGDPLDMQDRFLSDYTENIGKTRYDGAISGYRLGDRPLDIGLCGITESSLATDGDFDVALYFTPGIDGYNEAGTSLFNRQDAWSTAGAGHNPVKRIFQKGALNYFFLPIGVSVDSLDLPGEADIAASRFESADPPELPTLPDEMTVDGVLGNSRVSHAGNVWVFEQVGRRLLYDTALNATGPGRTLTNDAAGDTSFVRDGTYDDTGAAFSAFGFVDGDAAAVVDAVVVRTDGQPASDDDLAAVHRIQCGLQFRGLALDCS